jgi:hypothetical protein
MRELWAVVRCWLVAACVRLFRATWRVRVVGEPPPRPALYAFWHGDQIALTTLPRSLVALVSRSTDGELAARVLRRLGFGVVRGSSSRGAVGGALGLIRCLRAGRPAAIAVDGPRGPRHRASDSALRIAARAGVELVPVVAAAHRSLALRSWDRLCIPAPFTTVTVVWGGAVREDLEETLRTLWAAAQLEGARAG